MGNKNMKAKNLVDILFEEWPTPIKRSDIAFRLKLSESSVRDIIRDVKKSDLNNGFQINIQKGKGYVLQIVDDKKFKRFLATENNIEYDIYNPKQRLEILLFYILQVNGYITLNQLEEKLFLSRSTITKELKNVELKLSEFDLKLERKAHYGITVKGSEENFRKAFSKYVLRSDYYVEPAKEYQSFIEKLDTNELIKVLKKGMEENNLTITDVAFENIISHLKILIFRASQENFISQKSFLSTKFEQIYFQVASYVINWIEERFNISFPESEIQFLATHISAKSIATTSVSEEIDEMKEELNIILDKLDQEFLTNFQEDLELRESLLLHMFPLLKRLYYNLQLENPIIEEIYTKYSNVFVVSYRFAELIEKKYGFILSRDEIGYLALHFATYFERLRGYSLTRIKRIGVICTTGGGSSQLLRLKIERAFVCAIVVTNAAKDIADFNDELPDLFLSTVPIGEAYKGVPIIQIKQLLDEEEIQRIKEIIFLQSSNKEKKYQTFKIAELFSEKLFQRKPSGDYLKIIKEQGEKMIAEGFAAPDFAKLVLDRENKFSTIYQNGVAGPHSIILNAKIDSIGVTILEEPIQWCGKNVQLIFLTNLKQGNLFIHKEVSRFLLFLMENDIAREGILGAQSFEMFIAEIEKLSYR